MILAAIVAALVATLAPAPSVHVRTFRFVDRTRVAHFADGRSGARVLVTTVRIPSGRGPFPLVVFAHGFALTPAPYAPLLDAWARAGYAVAAPRFPVENEDAPGGPSESDLLNEPGDIRFVITRLEHALPGVVDPRRIAVAGHSDGAEAALGAAYDRRYRDRRIDAALILSGAAFPGFEPPGRGAPPLLAVQGTADRINPPVDTSTYFALMRRPKYLLWLVGAGHEPPYTTHDAWAPIVRRATIRFLDHYLRGASLGSLTGGARLARLQAEP